MRFDPALDGGALMDVGCYCVSGSRLLAGEPLEISARQVLSPSGIDVRLAGTLVFPGDVLAQIDCAFDLPLRQGLEVVGSEGTLRVATPWGIDAPWACSWTAAGKASGSMSRPPTATGSSRTTSAARSAASSRRCSGAQDALGQARTIDGLYRSAERGGLPVSL